MLKRGCISIFLGEAGWKYDERMAGRGQVFSGNPSTSLLDIA
jgi:hypothetical protein